MAWSWNKGTTGSSLGPPVTTQPPTPATGTPPTTPAPTAAPGATPGMPDLGGISAALSQRFPGMAAKAAQYGPQIQQRLGEVFSPEMQAGLAQRFPGMAAGMERFKGMFPGMPGGGTPPAPGTPPAGGMPMGGLMQHWGQTPISGLPPGLRDVITKRWATIGGGQPMPTSMGDFFNAAKTYYAANPPIHPGLRHRMAGFLDGRGGIGT